MNAEQPEDVLQFWFSQPANADLAMVVRQWERWFPGGMDADIIEHFTPPTGTSSTG